MGKSLRQQGCFDSHSHRERGCVWGIVLNHFHHKRWPNVRKRLPQKTHSSDEDGSNNAPEDVDSRVETKCTKSSPTPKGSMKSRIKALIKDDKSKRKAWHGRTTSCPSKTQSSLPAAETTQNNDVVLRSINILDRLDEGPCELYASKLDGKQCERVRDLALDKAMIHGEPTIRQDSKMFLDAIDLLDVRKEMFMRIIEDPTSSLAHQRKHNLRLRLTRSGSSPLFVPMPERTFKPGSEKGDNKSSFPVVRKKKDNKAAINPFKSLSKTLKFVIRGKKKEKDRIVMDAVHHKVPFGKSHKNLERNADKFSNKHDQGYFSKSFKRTSSISESVDRYNQLLDPDTNRDAKEQERSRATNNRISLASLGRINSLPNIRCYFSIVNDVSDSTNTSVEPMEHKLLSIVSETGSEEMHFDIEESGDLKTQEFSFEPGDLFPTTEDDSSIHVENKIDIDIIQNDNISHIQVDHKNIAEFNYVKDILAKSGFIKDDMFEQTECYDKEWCGNDEGERCDFDLLFDLINEVLLGIQERSSTYWVRPLYGQSCVHRMPKGRHVLEEVWAEIRLSLRQTPQNDQVVDRDMSKLDDWMNLQVDAEWMGLELENLIFDDLIEEIVST